MPFTPYHFGPALLAGVVLFPFFDIVALMVCSIILDIEPIIVLFFGLGGPLHGISHTYLMATIVAIVVSVFLWFLRNPISSFASVLGIEQEPKKFRVLLASFFGTYSHVFMDSFIYTDMNPFFPILGNPFLGLIATGLIYQFCLICGALGIVLYFVRFCVLSQKCNQVVEDSPW